MTLRRAHYCSVSEAIGTIRSGERVFVHSVMMTPTVLLEALVARSAEVDDIEIVHIHTEGPAPYITKSSSSSFFHRSLFCGKNVRDAANCGNADYVPIFLSDIPRLFRQRLLPLDTALLTVSPPDAHGYCSLGTSVDVTVAAVECAKRVVAVVNPQAPRTHGDGVLHVDQIDYLVEHDAPLWTHDIAEPSPEEVAIGKQIAALVEDGATLQLGIGGVPNAVLRQLKSHRRLGVHTEMFSDGIIDLVESGVVTNEEKKVLPHRVVASFVMGSERVRAFVHDNPIIAMKETGYTNDTSIIRKNPKVVAINSCIEIDLTGQICADSIGTFQYSGVGGQMDFMRGASLSDGGKPIIAVASQTHKGVSKIVPVLKEGASVTTTRAHVHYVVTEHGTFNCFGKSLRERARGLIDLAHPDHREELSRAAYERFKFMV